MSIYATWLALDGDDDHTASCAAYYAVDANVWELTGAPCDCPARLRQPIKYQGSGVVPSEADERAGYVLFCSIPNHCAPEVLRREGEALKQMHEQGYKEIAPIEGTGLAFVEITDRTASILAAIQAEHGERVDFGRLSVSDGADDVVVILTRDHVTELRDTLTAWLEAPERG